MTKSRKIGEKFSTSKGTFEVKEGRCQDGCVFWTGSLDFLHKCRINNFARCIFGECSYLKRKDGKKAYFSRCENK